MSPALLRSATTVVATVVGVVLMAGPAAATPLPTIPPDVQAAFDGDALLVAQQSAEDARSSVEPAGRASQPDFSGAIRVEDIHEVFLFSMEFIGGVPTTEPLSRADQWWGGITRGNDVLGVLTVWKPDGGPAEFAGYSGDATMGSVLGGLTATDLLIDDAPTGAIYALNGNTVRPLNEWARGFIAGPAPLSELQKKLQTRHEHAVAMGSDVPRAPGLPIALGAMALTLAVGVVLTVRSRRRGTRSA
ncbi:MAG: hypothetical protein JWQ99_2044 [Blastococcus sp.]|nr:hypothetical protein [Blastococcus sp.]